MTILAARTQLAAKIESVEGTAETLAAADALLCSNPTFGPDTPMGERDPVSASMSPFASVPGKRSATMEFDIELKASGTAGTAPALGKLLKACGFGETISAPPTWAASTAYSVDDLVVPTTGNNYRYKCTVAGTSDTSEPTWPTTPGQTVVDGTVTWECEYLPITYDPASADIPSITLAFYMDGVCKKIWGARGNVSLRLEDGLPGALHFVFTGADFSVTDAALLTGVSYETTKPQPFLNASMQIDSYAALLGLVEINMNNSIKLREDVNKESGYLSAVITKRLPVMSLDPEMVTVATYDWFGKLRSGNEAAFTATLGSTAGNICTITAPKVQYTAIAPGEREGIRTLGIDCQLNRNSGDDELKIKFT